MSDINLRNKLARFLNCELDCNSGRLSVDGRQQKLEPMVHQFILLLIRKQGELVSKEEVLETLWPSKKPNDEALRAMVKKAREALKDNARNPIYIKTVPTKGYLLIPPVDLVSTMLQSYVQVHAKFIVWTAIVVSCTIVAFTWYLVTTGYGDDTPPKVSIEKSMIGVVQNKSVSTYYINGDIINMWVDSSDATNISQVLIENINTKQLQKVVFPVLLHQQFWYSQGSKRILLMRKDNTGFYAIDVNRQAKEASIKEYPVSIPDGFNVLGADFSGNYLFVSAKSANAFNLFSLDSGLQQTADARSPSILGASEQIEKFKASTVSTAPLNSLEQVKVKVWPSPVSSGFILSLEATNRHSLFYFKDAQTALPTRSLDLSNGLQSGVFNAQGNRFSFTDNSANLSAFQLDEGRITLFNANGELINQVVADCGANCFVLANTQGIPKLNEYTIPEVFATKVTSENASQHVQLVSTNTIARNEYLPQYTDEGLYFVSQQADQIAIVYRTKNNTETVIHEFSKQSQIDELVVDEDSRFLAGIVNQRPFVIDMDSTKIRYLPLTFPKVSHIHFATKSGSDTSDILTFYAETTIAGQTTNLRQPDGLYEYNMRSKQMRLLEAGIKVKKSIDLVDTLEKGSKRYNATFLLNKHGVGFINFQNNKASLQVEIGTNDCSACWQIHQNYLYQLVPSTYSSEQAYLLKTHLLTGEQSKVPLLLSDLLKPFSIHPSGNKIALSTRQSLQTELTQIKGIAQIY